MVYDLNNFENIDFTTDVQVNLNYIYHKLHSPKTITKNIVEFQIQNVVNNKMVILPCKLIYKNKYFTLKFNGKNSHNVYLIPFIVIFIDYETFIPNNNCYFENVHKTPEYSGTEIMTTILKLLKIINIQRVYLIDSAKTDDIDNLSYRMILEKGYSYYQRFGFQFNIYPNFWTRLDYQNNHAKLQHNIKNVIKKLRKVEAKLIDSLLSIEPEQYNIRIKYLIENNTLFKKLDKYLNDSIMCFDFNF